MDRDQALDTALGQIERAAIIHHLAQQLGGGDGVSIVADPDDPRFLHCTDFRQSFAPTAQRGRADGPNARASNRSGALQDGARHGGIVVDGPRVGHRANSSEAAARCGTGSCFDGFGAFTARLAQMTVHIDEPRRNYKARGINRLTIGC